MPLKTSPIDSGKIKEIIEKTIAVIYSSFKQKDWIKRRKEQQRLSKRDLDSKGWRMEKKWDKIMARIIKEGCWDERHSRHSRAIKKASA